jgi:uncharacterized membrane protein YhiD involved in acid resistance
MVWVNAALGAAAGLGQFRLAMIAGALTLAVLLILQPLERSIEREVEKRNGLKRGGPTGTSA